MSPASCPRCGADLPPKSRFCSKCGAPVGERPGETAVQELPPDETGPAPVDWMVAQRRLFGVTPPTAVFGLGIAALALGVLMLATGGWVWGVLLLAAAVILLAGFNSLTRRLPGDAAGFARVPLSALDTVRARAGAAVEAVAAHGSARIEQAGLKRELGELVGEREQRLRELGEAAYGDNRAATKELKQRLQEIDETIQAKEAEMTRVALAAHERIGRAQMQVQQTQILPADESPDMPEPARIPEPVPPPDEGQPPEPARVPEPYPPPDEGDRPEQPTIPEPGPE